MPGQVRCCAQAAVKCARAGFHDPSLTRRAFQQIRTTDIANKNEIASQKSNRLVRATTHVGDEITHVLRRVTGREQRLELDVSHTKGIAIFEKTRIGMTLRPFELPIGSTLLRQIRQRAMPLHQFTSATQVVGMNVRLGDRSDAKTVLFCQIKISIKVPLRVDHDRFTTALAADQICVLCERRVGDLSEKHDEEWLRSNGTGIAGTLDSGSLVPWHFGQQHRHAAPVRDACKHQTRTHKRAQSVKPGMHPGSQRDADQHHHASRNAYLPLERHRFRATNNRQTFALPAHHATLEYGEIFTACCLQLLIRLLGTLAAATDQHTTLGPAGSGPHRPCIKPVKRHQLRTLDVDFSVFRRRAHINQ